MDIMEVYGLTVDEWLLGMSVSDSDFWRVYG